MLWCFTIGTQKQGEKKVRYFVFSIVLLTAVVVQCRTEVMLPREISYPLCAYCCDGTAMVLDGGKRSLKILSPDFKKVTRTIPLSIGQGPGELSNNFFSNPGAILLFKDVVVICDKRRRKINFYDFRGVFRDEIQFRKPVTTMRKKNGSIIVFFQNNGRLPPVTFSQQIDEESKKVMKTTIVNQQLSIIKTVSGALSTQNRNVPWFRKIEMSPLETTGMNKTRDRECQRGR